MANSIGPKLHTLLVTLFSHTNTIAIHPSKIEIIGDLTQKISEEISKLATETSLEKCKVLNDAIQKAFRLMAKDLAEIESRIKGLEEKIVELEGQSKVQ